MTIQSYEGNPKVVNGTVTSLGLPRLLAAIWSFDLEVPEQVRRMKTKLGYVMQECGRTIRLPSGSFLNIEVTDQTKMIAGKKCKLFLIQGELEAEDLDAVMGCGIEDHWESYGDDELGSAFLELEISDSEAPHVSVHPSPPPSRRK